MCLITKITEPIVLTETMSVYKRLKMDGSTLIQKFKYDFDRLYETEFSFLPNENVWPTYSIAELSFLDTFYAGWCELGDTDIRKQLMCIAQGFHSAKEPDRLTGLGLTFECTIPGGATIYEDATGLIVSNKIIVHFLNKN